MKTIIIISFSDLFRDPRVNRQIRFLKDKYVVIAVGFVNPNIDGVEFINISPQSTNLFLRIYPAFLLLIGKYEKYYWRKPEIIYLHEKLNTINSDLIIVNDIDPLPLSIKLAEGKPSQIIFDAHEYAPLEFEDMWIFKMFFQGYKTYLCNQYIPRSNAMTTVCDYIAETYGKENNIKPVVITNAPEYEDLYPNYIDRNSRKIQLIHHGAAIKSRKIENMIKMMNFLDDRFELNFMLVSTDNHYISHLKYLARNNKNIHFLSPVLMRDLPKFTNQFDIGLFLLEPTNFNYRYALPNKLFEFIQARLAVAISPSPEMAKIVKQYDCGVVAEDFSPQALAKSLMQLDIDRINYYKQRSHEAAYELSAEKNKEKLLEIVASVLQE